MGNEDSRGESKVPALERHVHVSIQTAITHPPQMHVRSFRHHTLSATVPSHIRNEQGELLKDTHLDVEQVLFLFHI